jgi:hypothetical protein
MMPPAAVTGATVRASARIAPRKRKALRAAGRIVAVVIDRVEVRA